MKIVHLYKTYYPDTVGGVEKVIHQLTQTGSSLGIDAEVVALSRHPSADLIDVDGHRVHQFKSNIQIASTDFSWALLGRFADIARQADVIHYHYPWPYMDIVHFASRIKKPTVVTYHSDIIRQKILSKLYSPLKHAFLNAVDAIVATSPHYLSTSHDLIKYRDKTTVIPIGLSRSSYPTPDAHVLQAWKAKLPPRFFLFVGVLRYYKGLHVLLEALKSTPLPVVIAGAGPMAEQLKQFAKQNNLTSVQFLGEITEVDKAALFTLAYAVLFPSHLRSEAFGISLLEGAMYGNPLISCEIGTGTSYINSHQQTGLVVKPECSASLAKAMEYLWDNQAIANQMGEEAKKRYEALFTANSMGRSYVELYQQVIASR